MKRIKSILAKAPLAACIAATIAAAALPACIHVDPVTVDVNVHYVDKKLDEDFAYQQKYEQAPASHSTTQATTFPSSVNAQKVQERYPDLLAAKFTGKIGENTLGLVEVVDPKFLGDDQLKKLIQGENADRTALYESIAKEEKTTVDVVADRAAKRNYENARPGDYLKDKDGKWYQKS